MMVKARKGSVVAAVETVAAGHPGHVAFDDPAVTAQPGRTFLGAAGDPDVIPRSRSHRRR
jgi:hypothetical protein